MTSRHIPTLLCACINNVCVVECAVLFYTFCPQLHMFIARLACALSFVLFNCQEVTDIYGIDIDIKGIDYAFVS